MPSMYRVPFRIDWALLHELGHARSLADLYRFDFPVDSPSQIDVRAGNGQPAYNPLDPFGVSSPIRGFSGSDGGTLVYQNVERDLMSCVCSAFYSPYTAVVLNRLGNRRALCGNINAPCNIGDWYLDMPPRNVLRVLGASGRTPTGSLTVRLFYDSGVGYGTHRFAQSDSTVLTGRDGSFALPARPVSIARLIRPGRAQSAPARGDRARDRPFLLSRADRLQFGVLVRICRRGPPRRFHPPVEPYLAKRLQAYTAPGTRQ